MGFFPSRSVARKEPTVGSSGVYNQAVEGPRREDSRGTQLWLVLEGECTRSPDTAGDPPACEGTSSSAGRGRTPEVAAVPRTQEEPAEQT